MWAMFILLILIVFFAVGMVIYMNVTSTASPSEGTLASLAPNREPIAKTLQTYLQAPQYSDPPAIE
jgi:flagellar basal body-associated protein FliL